MKYWTPSILRSAPIPPAHFCELNITKQMASWGKQVMRIYRSVHISRHLKTSTRKLQLGRKWVFQVNNDPKRTFRVVEDWIKDNTSWSGQRKAVTYIWPENLWAELKKCVRARRPTNPTQLHQLCLGQNSSSLPKETCKRLPKTSDPS